MRRFAGFALLFVSLACDPTRVSDDAVTKTAKKAEEVEMARAKSVDDEKAAKDKTFRECMAACAGDPATEPTDRGTCRLQCQQLVGDKDSEPKSSTADAVLTTFDSCEAKCEADAKSTDGATCRFNCTQTAAAKVTPAGATADDTTRGCASACLENLVSCEGKCPPGGDDASTCTLHCETDVKRCLGRCEG